MTVFTIGYEGVNIDEFLSALIEHDIETVVDVRELPLSRKQGFSKTALAGTLRILGLQYVHMAPLGCPKSVRQQYRLNKDWKQYTNDFLKHLDSQTDSIENLASLTKKSRCALVCFEADYNFCHRSIVANAVRDCAGSSIIHIRAKSFKNEDTASHLLALA